jgi:hypothetical protein
MFERLLSRLRGHRRRAARRRNRERAWPRDSQIRSGGGPDWAGGGPAGGTGGPGIDRPGAGAPGAGAPGAGAPGGGWPVGPAGPAGSAGPPVGSRGPAEPWGEPGGRHRRDVSGADVPAPAGPGHDTPAAVPVVGQPAGAVRVGGARARVRERPDEPDPTGSPVRTQPMQHRAAGQPRGGPGTGTGGRPQGRRPRGRQAQRTAAQAAQAAQDRADRDQAAQAAADEQAAQAWQQMAGGWQRPDGSQHCGSLEPLVHRQWDAGRPAPAIALHAVRRLAELPQKLKDMLAAAVDAIYVGPGGVPELDEMGRLRGVPLPSGRATWDACAGAYGDRKIVVGTRPSPSPDVMCHEVGHAIDDSDAPPGHWQSDSAEFRMLYDQCLPHLVSDFHRQPGALGRREFFADAFSAIASRQRPALVDMLGGSTRVALNVMLYYNRRYGI